jgi:fatty acid desaturase
MNQQAQNQQGLGTRNRKALKIEWPTLALILGCYGTWFLAGIYLWPFSAFLALPVMAVCVALQSSLVHEVLHGHPTRSAAINEALVSLPIGLVWPYRRFKTLHLRHHADERLTDPFDDPESYYQALWKHAQMPNWLKAILRINNTMLGRLALGPWLSGIGLILGDAKSIRSGDREIAVAWGLQIMGVVVVALIVTRLFAMPLWMYGIFAVWPGLSAISIRTYAEHQWSEDPNGRTIIVEKSPLAALYLYNNLHFVHHARPTAPWYHLPAMFRERRDDWVRENNGYVFPNYRTMLRAYAFKAKEPVVHPALRLTPECGGAVAWRAQKMASKRDR